MRTGLFVALSGTLATAVCGGARAETLYQALASAYSNNSDLVGARAHLRATDEQVPQALSGWRPTVTVTASGAGQVLAASGTSGLLPIQFAYRQWAYGGAAKLDWPVYQGDRTRADVARAEATVGAGRADLLGTEENVLLEAATAYDDVVRTRALLKLYKELEAGLQKYARETAIRMQAGQLTETDVVQAQNRLSGARATRIGAEGDEIVAVARYVAAIGHPPSGPMTAVDKLPGLPASPAEAIQLAETNNPAVIGSQRRAEAAREAADVAKADLLPNMNLTIQAGIDQGQSLPTVPSKSYSGTLSLTLPLYQNGAAESRLRQAKAAASESKIQTWTSQRDAKKTAETDYALWQAAVDRAVEEKRQVQLAEKAYQGVQKQAALGAKSTFEVLSQLQEFYNARIDELRARFDAKLRAYQLLVAVGRFNATDLNLQIPIYDPTVNYSRVRASGGTVLPWVLPWVQPLHRELYDSPDLPGMSGQGVAGKPDR